MGRKPCDDLDPRNGNECGTLELEAAKLPAGLIPRLTLQAGVPVALIDDDPTRVHLLWQARWEALGSSVRPAA